MTAQAFIPAEVYTKAEIDAMFSTIGTPFKKHVPVVYTLFGPAHMQCMLSQAVGPNWTHIGSALTASTVQIPAHLELGRVVVAFLRVLWNPMTANCALRLVKHDDGPANIEQIAILQGKDTGGQGIFNEGVIVTDQLQAIVNAKQWKNLLFQMKDDGVTPWRLFGVRLEVTWEV